MQKSDGQWTRAKGFDSFCPIGPWIETDLGGARPGPGRPRGHLHVDGEPRQQGRTSQLIFDVPTLISYISQVMTLLPGDVVLTGTPSGVGPIAPGPAGRRARSRAWARCPTPSPPPTPSRPPAAPDDRTVRTRFCPSPTGHGARRPDADGAVQLGARPAHRRHVRLPHRGHRRRPRLRGVLPAPARLPALARASTGTRAPRSAARTGPTGSRSGTRSTATSPPSCWPPGTPTSPSPPTRRSTPAGSPPGRTPSSATTTTTASSPRSRRPPSAPRAASRCCGCGCPTRTWSGPTSSAARSASPPARCPTSSLVRGNGVPLYPFVNPVDDALMGITDVLRGEDLLPSTPRQIALYAALTDIGVAQGTPRFGHLPYVMGEGNKKLSKRDPQSNLDIYRERGFLPEGLGQLPGAARLVDRRRPRHLLDGRDGRGLRRHPGQRQPGPLRPEEGRGDQRHPPARAAGRGVRRRAWSRTSPAAGLVSRAADGGAGPRPAGDRAAGAGADDRARPTPSGCSGSCSSTTSRSTRRPPRSTCARTDAGDARRGDGGAARARPTGRRRRIEEALKAALVEGLGLKPRQAFGPVRVAVSGRTVSPPLYESMELLGRERTLARLAAARAMTERSVRGMTGCRAAGGRAVHRAAADPTAARPVASPRAAVASRRRAAWVPPVRGLAPPPPLAAPAAGGALGAAAGDPAARRPAAVPAGHAVAGLGMVASAAGAAAARRRLPGRRHGRRPRSRLADRGRHRPRACSTSTDPVILLVTNLSLIVAIPVRVAGLGGRTACGRLVVVGARPAALAAAAAATSLLALRHARVRHRAVGAGRLRARRGRGHRAGRARSAGCWWSSCSPRPLQSAAEEYLFRGLPEPGDRRLGAGARGPARCWPRVVTAALFSAAHVPADVPTFLDRFAFGLAASAVVWLTGGLEASIVLHAVNNVLVFVLAGALGDGVGDRGGAAAAPACCTCWSASLVALAALRAAGGAVAAPAAAGDAHRGAWTCGRRAERGRAGAAG